MNLLQNKSSPIAGISLATVANTECLFSLVVSHRRASLHPSNVFVKTLHTFPINMPDVLENNVQLQLQVHVCK